MKLHLGGKAGMILNIVGTVLGIAGSIVGGIAQNHNMKQTIAKEVAEQLKNQ